jgi:hypothetical protein
VTITAPVVAGGTGISVSGSQTTSLSISNSGVTSIVAGTNVSVSAATGAVTVNAPAYGTTITASTIGGTAAAGTSTSVAREDHKHAFPAGAAPSALTVSSTQATGTSTAPALADHVHAMPGSAIAGASAVGDTAATGTATTVALSDHRHSREAFGTPGAVTGGATAASGSATTLARSDHVHSTASMPVLLASTTLASDTASFTWSSISSAYTNLEVRAAARSDVAQVTDFIQTRYNGDTGSNYRTVTDAPNTRLYLSPIHGATNAYASHLSPSIHIINNYKSTTYKHVYSIWAVNLDGTANALTSASWHGVWMNTSAITSITLAPANGTIFKSGSTFQLYGLP